MSQSFPKLVAHRGYALRYPENTLLAIQAAVEAGARFIEFDVLMSSDLVPVLFHDRDLIRMCGKEGTIHDYTLSQLKTFSVSEFHKFGYKFFGNPITSLAEITQYLSGCQDITVFVEIKRQALQHFGIDTVIEKILRELEVIHNQVVIISYSLEALSKVREISDYPVAAVFDNWTERKSSLIHELKPEYLFTDIDQLPRFGKLEYPQSKLAVYECTDPEKAVKVHQRGIEFVETFAIAEMLHSFRMMSERV